MSLAKVTFIIFDCDNTLVQSEPIGFQVSAEITNEILALRGIDDVRFTGPQLQREFVGMTFQNMMLAILAKYNLGVQLSKAELDHYAEMEDTRVISKLLQPGNPLQACVGVNDVLDKLAKDTTVSKRRLAVVSSSALARIRASLGAAGQAAYFAEDDVFSAVNSMPTPISKPDPAIYRHALRQLGCADPRQCVAIEDSRSGVLSASGAGIPVIGYTAAYEADEREALTLVLKEAGCAMVMQDWAEFPTCLDLIEKSM